jgi:phosphatidylserine/phosphatidylglycerophosphate/cardiolipin synthase-like enzyme
MKGLGLSGMLAWARWAAQYADSIDVRQTGDGMPAIPDPKPEELKPYQGWHWSRATLPTVVEVYQMHQKIIVIDERTVLLGSLNALSQRTTREVMLTLQGEYFARKLLAHEHAVAFSAPPPCGACHGATVQLRRTVQKGWHWRCYATTCPRWDPRGRTNWTEPVTLDRSAKRTGEATTRRRTASAKNTRT